MILPIHILAGMLALGLGYVALFAAKGASLHRRAGMFFVYAMVVMSLTGAYRASITGSRTSVIAGLLTFYFVITGVLTVRRTPRLAWIDGLGLAIALVVGAMAFVSARELSMLGRAEAPPMFVFGAMAALGAIGDARMMRNGGIPGPQRLARHLWRLCFAMWVAAASFFWGPPGRVPAIINIPALLPIPVLTPIAVMLYWLWRIRVRKSLRGIYEHAQQRTAQPQAS